MQLVKRITILSLAIVIFPISSHVFAKDWGLRDITRELPIPKDIKFDTDNQQHTQTGQQTRTPLDELAHNDIVKGTLAGAAIGAVTGAIFGGKKGAVIGAAGGAVAGFIAGNVAASRRREFASEQEFLEAEIASAENAISTKETQITKLEKESDSMSREIDELEARYERNEDIKQDANKRLKTLDKQIQKNQEVAEDYENSIEYLDEVLRTTNKKASPTSAERKEKEQQVAQMKAKRNELSAQYAKLIDANDQMMSDRDRLAKLIEKAENTKG